MDERIWRPTRVSPATREMSVMVGEKKNRYAGLRNEMGFRAGRIVVRSVRWIEPSGGWSWQEKGQVASVWKERRGKEAFSFCRSRIRLARPKTDSNLKVPAQLRNSPVNPSLPRALQPRSRQFLFIMGRSFVIHDLEQALFTVTHSASIGTRSIVQTELQMIDPSCPNCFQEDRGARNPSTQVYKSSV